MYNNYELLKKKEELEQRIKDLLQGLRKKKKKKQKKQELSKHTYEGSITELVYKMLTKNRR